MNPGTEPKEPQCVATLYSFGENCHEATAGSLLWFNLVTQLQSRRVIGSHRDAPDDARLAHQVHEGVFDPHQDVSGHPVAATLLDVGAGGVGVVAARRRRPGCHGAVAHRTGTGTGLQSASTHTHISARTS